jgi:hypothetical protein
MRELTERKGAMADTPVEWPDVMTSYDQLCLSYRVIDDFRAKLLSFVPFVTGGGIVSWPGRTDDVPRDFVLPVGLLGVAVTIGLFAYELYGIKFSRRPEASFSPVNEPFAAAAI